MNRRDFFSSSAKVTAAAFATSMLPASIFAAAAKAGRAPRILLRSSWQSVNIGDIGHTPGVLAILEKHFPEAEVILWPSTVAAPAGPCSRHGSCPSAASRGRRDSSARLTGAP